MSVCVVDNVSLPCSYSNLGRVLQSAAPTLVHTLWWVWLLRTEPQTVGTRRCYVRSPTRSLTQRRWWGTERWGNREVACNWWCKTYDGVERKTGQRVTGGGSGVVTLSETPINMHGGPGAG